MLLYFLKNPVIFRSITNFDRCPLLHHKRFSNKTSTWVDTLIRKPFVSGESKILGISPKIVAFSKSYCDFHAENIIRSYFFWEWRWWSLRSQKNIGLIFFENEDFIIMIFSVWKSQWLKWPSKGLSQWCDILEMVVRYAFVQALFGLYLHLRFLH